MTFRLLNTPQYQYVILKHTFQVKVGGAKVKKGVWRVTAISDQKQFNEIIIVSICCHYAQNMLKVLSCMGGGSVLSWLTSDLCGLNTTRQNVMYDLAL